jgi:hypothetical protein
VSATSPAAKRHDRDADRDLGKIGALLVISRTSVMRCKAARKPLPEIAAELGVDALLEGSVIREGDRVGIITQLIDGRPDHHPWSERYDRDLRGILELQSDVARAVARRIQLELAVGESTRLANRPPSSGRPRRSPHWNLPVRAVGSAVDARRGGVLRAFDRARTGGSALAWLG